MFDDGPNQQIGRPVTTVCTSLGNVGNQAVKMLLLKIAEPSQPVPSVATSPWLFNGNTTGRPHNVT
jgi:DNA-binding LacI/PurR family transcriptional regulator